MKKFFEEIVRKGDYEDKGILVSEALGLIENNEYKEKIIELLGIGEIKADFISIPGSGRLVKRMLLKDKELIKFDIIADTKDVECVDILDSSSSELKISNIRDEKAQEIIQGIEVTAETIYNSKRDFLDGMYQINKFANFCVEKNLKDIVFKDLEKLKEIYSKDNKMERRYRLLKDSEDKYYIRALTSVGHYYDYDIKFSVFITLVSLHKLMKEYDMKFEISYAEYDESNIRLYIEKSNKHFIENIGEVKLLIELTNDEIKNEALHFTISYAIEFKDKDKKKQLILGKNRNKIGTKILSIKHNIPQETVFKDLKKLEEIHDYELEMYEDIEKIRDIKKPDELRYHFFSKIARSRTTAVKKYKNDIQKLEKKVNTVHELLLMMEKVDLLVTELEAKEYIRYLAYETLIRK